MDILKPCPFCGSEAESRVYYDDSRRTEICVGCTDRFCWCRHKLCLGLAPNKLLVESRLQEMLIEWNHRKGVGNDKRRSN